MKIVTALIMCYIIKNKIKIGIKTKISEIGF